MIKKYFFVCIAIIICNSLTVAYCQVYDWALAITSISGSADPIAMIADGNNNIYITGYITGTLDFDPSPDTALVSQVGIDFGDLFLAKYDSSGNFLWAFAIGAGGIDVGRDLAADAFGNIYLAGSFAGKVDFDPSSDTAFLNNGPGFLAKYDPSGNYLWAIAMSGELAGIAIDMMGNITMAGVHFGINNDFDPSPDTASLNGIGIFIAKYDTNGSFLWVKGMNSATNDVINSGLDIDNNDNIIITGRFKDSIDFDPSPSNAYLSGLGNSNTYIAKYDSDGNYILAKSIGSDKTGPQPSYSCRASDIKVDKNDNIYITGIYNDSIDFDPSGNQSIMVAPLWGNIFIAKYSPAGEYIWAKSIGGGNGGHTGMAIAINNNNSVFITGNFKDTVFAENNAISSSGNGVLLAKYSTNGDYLWAFGVNANAANLTILLDSKGNPVFSGLLGDALAHDFDPSPDTAWLTGEAFIAKYTDTLKYLSVYKPVNSTYPIRLYPNPATESLIIEFDGHTKIEDYRIYNLMGQEVIKSNNTSGFVSSAGTVISVKHLNKGIYILKIKNSSKIFYKKFLKM